MILQDIRNGITENLADIADVRALSTWPDSPPWGTQTVLVLVPDDPYVQYPEGTGRVSRADIRFRLVALPLPSKGPSRVQAELDELISTGTGATRSVRDRVAMDISAGGSTCAVWVTEVAVRSFRLGEVEAVGAEFSLMVQARGV